MFRIKGSSMEDAWWRRVSPDGRTDGRTDRRGQKESRRSHNFICKMTQLFRGITKKTTVLSLALLEAKRAAVLFYHVHKCELSERGQVDLIVHMVLQLHFCTFQQTKPNTSTELSACHKLSVPLSGMRVTVWLHGVELFFPNQAPCPMAKPYQHKTAQADTKQDDTLCWHLLYIALYFHCCAMPFKAEHQAMLQGIWVTLEGGGASIHERASHPQCRTGSPQDIVCCCGECGPERFPLISLLWLVVFLRFSCYCGKIGLSDIGVVGYFLTLSMQWRCEEVFGTNLSATREVMRVITSCKFLFPISLTKDSHWKFVWSVWLAMLQLARDVATAKNEGQLLQFATAEDTKWSNNTTKETLSFAQRCSAVGSFSLFLFQVHTYISRPNCRCPCITFKFVWLWFITAAQEKRSRCL